MKILIVDDLAANRKLLRIQLENEGLLVVEAVDGIEALEVLAREPIDAVLSDILMPRMDGYRLCHAVRKNPALQGLRFVLYSGTYTAPGDTRLSNTVGADQFVAKPAPISVIMQALQISAAGSTPRPSSLPDDAFIVQQYSAVLVAKLEEKNTELQQALEMARCAHNQIHELNVDLDRRVIERTAELAKTNGGLTTALVEVKQLNELLREEIGERTRAEAALNRAQAQLSVHAGELEGLVAERTSELAVTNKRLEASVHSSSKGKEEYRALFLESQIMQRKLRQLTRQIITAQEEERREISRELHDGVVQTLVGINIELAALGEAAQIGNRAFKAKITRTKRLVGKSMDAVHQFARELRPSVLDDLGLIPALLAHMKIVADRNKLKIHLTAFAGVETLDNARRVVLYRVAQEALVNVVRHAEAGVVNVCISEILGAIRLELHDNGKSFPVSQTLSSKTNKRLGLLGMRERVEMVGGTLTIESAPGQGTTVRAEVPFRPRAGA